MNCHTQKLQNLRQHYRAFSRIRIFIYCTHRRRIKTGEKAKVVTSVWGEDFIQFLSMLAVLHRM